MRVLGALFTMKRLESDNSTSTVRKFFSVFAKRVALTAGPVSCQNCECNGDLNGIPYMDCISCLYPPPINFDFVSKFSFINRIVFANNNNVAVNFNLLLLTPLNLLKNFLIGRK